MRNKVFGFYILQTVVNIFYTVNIFYVLY